MLAAPLELEFKTDYQKHAVNFLMILGIAAACVIVPGVGLGLLAMGKATAVVGGLVTVAQTAKITYGERYSVASPADSLPDCKFDECKQSDGFQSRHAVTTLSSSQATEH